MAMDSDGRWDNGRDDGLRFDRDDAAAATLRLTPAVDDGVRRAVAASARAVFEHTGEALGEPRPRCPRSGTDSARSRTPPSVRPGTRR
ncbi:MAG TPA: hypothetical protein VGD12_11825 [Blastococcus sp.]|jgi:hypothetical protein